LIRSKPWIVTVPMIVLLGFASGWLSNSGYGNPWFDALAKPAFMPPGWLFPIAWTTLYVLMGVAVGQVIASAAPVRRLALHVFAIQLVLNLLWSPIFFGLHQADIAFVTIVVLTIFVAITILLFWGVRRSAALLMLPYLAWLLFATALNFAIVRLNG
jgi:tryptophan-rich sensory protein